MLILSDIRGRTVIHAQPVLLKTGVPSVKDFKSFLFDSRVTWESISRQGGYGESRCWSMFIQGRKQPLAPHSDFWQLRLNLQQQGETRSREGGGWGWLTLLYIKPSNLHALNYNATHVSGFVNTTIMRCVFQKYVLL
jgi:hypothetical protein